MLARLAQLFRHYCHAHLSPADPDQPLVAGTKRQAIMTPFRSPGIGPHSPWGQGYLHPARPVLAGWRLRIRQVRLVPGFVKAMVRAAPAGLRWMRHKNPADRARVKSALGLAALPPHLLHPEILSWRKLPQTGGSVTLIVPVYNAFDVLPECLDRLIHHTDLPWRLIVIEDHSTDTRVRPWVRKWIQTQKDRHPGRVFLLETETNIGFVGAANRGLAQALCWDDPVVLVNSDTLVPARWASRLIAPLRRGGNVASVTPMSNDAELGTVPVICRRNDLYPGEADHIDTIARHLNPGVAQATAPTGVGFCMALNPQVLKRFPAFDKSFGPGYGEEVDWCQKVLGATGAQHVYVCNLFVEHRGGHSFGSARKQNLLRRNGARIASRYPGFDAEVQAFLRTDPLRSGRLALALAWADARVCRAGRAVPVYLAHTMGGGAEFYLQDRLRRDLSHHNAAVVLRVGGTHRFELELHSPQGRTTACTDDPELVQKLLGLLSRRHVVYSCAVGDPDPITLPALLLRLASGPAHRLEVLFHDYFPISPAYTLLNADRRFHGLPDPETSDPAHRVLRPGGGRAGLRAWQEAWGHLLAAADCIVTFSEDSRAHTARAYPLWAEKITVIPHRPLAAIPRIPPPPDPVRTIGVLGNIGEPKGAAVLSTLSRRLAHSGEARLVVIGEIDPHWHLAWPSRVHGPYTHAQIGPLTRRYGIARWLIPSIWPETFSYTTQEALATGLPVYCFDLGAQAEAVSHAMSRGAPGGLIPFENGEPDLDALFGAIAREGPLPQARWTQRSSNSRPYRHSRNTPTSNMPRLSP
ncbi:GT2 family glycosyltransferase [Rhodovulum imhoffii]|uniref:GT2 family glycosyltransferase n=1 Tax=Rhodovulum imhoffii TaxID=365340 RepID=A0A2T5BPI8_9RHOB|nr:glycosyltransferase [Rhodovulum imhoffii]MBK5932938.1 hypothetical protein [Rhodovulum imhoffii]PTN00874.1 GT2 family glycosyltransferase [Rhodovulum imhoffii]